MPKNTGSNVATLTEGDVTRQAELVVMEYLKSTRCAKTLDAIMSHGPSSSSVSPISSDLYAEDFEKKKKTGATSVLDFMVSTMVEQLPAETTGSSPTSSTSSSLDKTLSRRTSSSSSSRRRGSTDDSGDEKAAVEWTRDEVHLLKKAIKQTSEIDDKNERWKQIASIVGNGKTKKHCYLKYKELKDEKSSSSRSSSIERPRSRRSSSSDDKSRVREVSPSPATTKTTVAVSSGSEVPALRPTPVAASEEEIVMTKRAPSAASSRQATPRTGAEVLQVEDCDDFDSAPVMAVSRSTQAKASSSPSSAAASGRPPTAEEVDALRDILFPAGQKGFSSHWEEQGFFFSDARDLRYGLIQHQGGPCGVLAVVQAFVLRFLFETVRPSDWRNPTQRDQEQALVDALAHILWQAARSSRRSDCVVVVNDAKAMSASAKRKFMTGTLVFTTTSLDQTKALLAQHVCQFTAPKSNGLVLLVVSALLSKRVATIKPDMDSVEGALGGGGKLIGAHDYCTQEIVNLLLCGVASSNVFNGKQLLDGTSEDDPQAVVLKGIPARSDVGFLSLFEAYEYIVVGSHLKVPRFNVWVVCSESHYSVLFADPTLLTSDAIHDKMPTLDVYYFDGLGNQDEEIRLTVHSSASTRAEMPKLKSKPDDLVPPLNLVVQTKWPLARIDWNGVDPLL